MQENVTEGKNRNIKLDMFEGPFDLLLSLLEKNKLEITDIPISLIADQYIDYIFAAGVFDVELASEFVVMGSSLLHMKSRKLLPKPLPETEELTEEELAEHLMKYKQYKETAVRIAEFMEYWDGSVCREQELLTFSRREDPVELTADALVNAYESAKLRYETSRNDNTGKMNVILKIEKVSLRDKIKHVISVLSNKKKILFSEVFNLKKNTKAEVVTGFLAILELDRNKSVRLEQKKLFGDIDIIKAKDDMQEGLANLEGYDEWD